MSATQRNTARSRIRRALEEAGARGCTNGELCRPEVGGNRFGARLKELRDEGLPIEPPVREGPGKFRYFLRDFPPTAASPLPPEVPAAVPVAVSGDSGGHIPASTPSVLEEPGAGAAAKDGPGDSGRLFELPRPKHDTVEEKAA